MLAGADPEVGLILETFTLSHGRPTIVASESLTDEEATLAAQLVHIGAMYTPGLRDVLGVQPISAAHWMELLFIALILLVAMEVHKLLRRLPN